MEQVYRQEGNVTGKLSFEVPTDPGITGPTPSSAFTSSKLLRLLVFSIHLPALPSFTRTFRPPHYAPCTCNTSCPSSGCISSFAFNLKVTAGAEGRQTAPLQRGPHSAESPRLGGKASWSRSIFYHIMIENKKSPATPPVGEPQCTVLKIMNMLWTIILPGHCHS